MSGSELVQLLSKRYPDRDWVAALGKAMVLPRHDVEAMLTAADVPRAMLDAVTTLPAVLEPGDAGATDDIFLAATNSNAAVMEVDGESGMIVSPSNKGMPSQSGSECEMRTKEPKAQKNSEFLDFTGVPETILPLRAKKDPA